MKLVNFRSCVRSICTALVVCVTLLIFTGCQSTAPGETASEVSRRHDHIYNVNTDHQMQADLDAWFLYDRSSRLSGFIVK